MSASVTGWVSTSVALPRPDLREYEVIASTRSFTRHVETARRILRDGAARGPMAVSVSWGKDSLALAHLALDTLGPVPLFHMASPYGLPGYDECRAYFAARATVHELPASRSLAEYIAWCQDIGLPHERERNVHQKAVSEIKRDRGTEWAREHGFTVQALGMRIAEKGPRARVLRKRGPVYEMADGSWKCCPLAYWTTKEVWAYLVSRGVPYNRRLYDAETHGQTRETLRNTGWLSTDGAEEGRIAWLAFHFPDEYATLAAHFPQVQALR